MDQVSKSLLQGMSLEPLKVLTNEEGSVKHMLRADSSLFKKFGEVYFSTVNHGVVKAWKVHLEMTQHFAVPVGAIQIVCYDGRAGSGTKGNILEVVLGESNYSLLRIPPGIWYGFKGLTHPEALIANCTDMPFSEHEVQRLPKTSGEIPYKWS